MVSTELVAFLLPLAAKFSGYPVIPLSEVPPIRQISDKEIRITVCPDSPDDCGGLVGLFDTEKYEIILRDDLDMDDATDNSILLHELVHVLQFKKNGDAIFKDCPTTMKTETEAYRAQNAYLSKEGQFRRFGEALAFMTCAGVQDTFFTKEVMIQPKLMK